MENTRPDQATSGQDAGLPTAAPPLPPPMPPEPHGKAKKGALAWWAIFPLLLYLVCEIVWGWPLAKANASDPDYVLSYWMGSFAGISLIAAILSWVVYRVGRRSRLAGTVTFTILLVLATLGVVSESSRIEQYASFGTFGFQVPAHWHQISRPDDPAVNLVMDGATKATMPGVLRITTAPADNAAPAQVVQRIQQAETTDAPTVVLLDGAQGYRVRIHSTDVLKPHFVAVASRNGKTYLISAGGQDDYAASAAVDKVIATWRWTATIK